MRLAGFFLLPAGWFIVLSAIAMLNTAPARAGFLLSGIAIELVGLVLVVRTHIPRREGRK